MQGSRNARSRKCAVPRRDRLVRRETGLRQSSNGPAQALGGRIPLGPPSPADGMGGGTSLRVALPELAISPLRLGGDGCRSADDQRTILGPVHAHLCGTFRTRSRCCARAATAQKAVAADRESQ